MTIPGIHHITAIAGAAQENLDFYTEGLGLRLVKTTVNFDDPTTYHLYYGDTTGRPGTILTFFPWPRAVQGRAGAGTASAVAFAVPSEAVSAWQARLDGIGVETEQTERFGETVLRFDAPDGLSLEIQGNRIKDLRVDMNSHPWMSNCTTHQNSTHFVAPNLIWSPSSG